jgi:hypothetical protein
MKSWLFILFLFVSGLTKAANYYVDPSSDSTAERGTISAPWKSLTMVNDNQRGLKPGDTVFLKRGEIFFDKLNLKINGTAIAPIVFSSYGDSKLKPILMYKAPSSDKIHAAPFAIRITKSSFVKFEGIEITDDNMDKVDHSGMSLIKIAFSIDESNNISIRKCDISRVGIGVNIVGNNNLIEQCTVKNMRMVVNTSDGGYDDYGANGVVVAGSGNTISQCFFADCWANSYDFEFDGGAVELAGPNCSNNKIINNKVFNCNGFVEMGSTEGGLLANNYFADNMVVNCGDLLYINNDGPFAVDVENLQLVNNLFIQTFPQRTKPKCMMAMAKASSKKNIINWHHNIFWLPMQIDVARAQQFGGIQSTHSNNIYYLGAGKLNFAMDKSEKVFGATSKELNNLVASASLKQIDLLPFRYILKYWYLMF